MNKIDIWVAVIMSLLWVTFSGIYIYKDQNLIFYGINIFPLTMWILGLLALRVIYDSMKSPDRFLLAMAIYWFLLISIEYVGYNITSIQLASNYEGIFGLKALHVPTYAKIYYLMAGPGYLFLTNIFHKKWGSNK